MMKRYRFVGLLYGAKCAIKYRYILYICLVCVFILFFNNDIFLFVCVVCFYLF